MKGVVKHKTTKMIIAIKGGKGSGHFDHAGRPGKVGGSTSIDVDGTFPSKQAVDSSIRDGMIDYDEEYILKIGDDIYEIKTEGWWPDCLESRGLCATSVEEVSEYYVEIMTNEAGWNSIDIYGYIPDADNSPDYGVSYIGRKITIKAIISIKGGKGSGHHGHSGRPGKVGGSSSDKSLGIKLNSLKLKLAKAAQRVVDDWEQDEEGFDIQFGGGGACDEVCQAMGGVIVENINLDLEILDGGQPGDDHAWLVVHNSETGEAFGVDIPAGVYERGGGYAWTKLEDVKIEPSDVDIWELDIDLA